MLNATKSEILPGQWQAVYDELCDELTTKLVDAGFESCDQLDDFVDAYARRELGDDPDDHSQHMNAKKPPKRDPRIDPKAGDALSRKLSGTHCALKVMNVADGHVNYIFVFVNEPTGQIHSDSRNLEEWKIYAKDFRVDYE